jgi:hypothetical protein
VIISLSGGRGRGRGRGDGNSRDNGNSGGRGNRNSKDSIDQEVEWMMKETDSEEMVPAAVELGIEVTVEDICSEGNYLCCFFFLLSTGFLYYGMSTL